MSVAGQPAAGPRRTAPGEVTVDGYGYGLGPPTGILVHHYPPQGPLEFRQWRDDYLHQLYWSPSGMLGVRRGLESVFVGPRECFWVRRGVEHEVHSPAGHELYRICLRQAPAALDDESAATAALSAGARAAVVELCSPGVSDDHAMGLRATLLEGVGGTARAVTHRGGGGPAAEVVRAITLDPGDPSTLEEWARRLHVSAKTLQRDFHRGYGASWSEVRTGLRLRAATVLLESMSVAEVAHRVGYASTSSFVQAFSRATGTTPGSLQRGGADVA